ncbi:hypothetical protein BX616_008043 [Lobosporangium transversale]|nr:hypothetical protein BX616_008043 [Lobosporangium transversale]
MYFNYSTRRLSAIKAPLVGTVTSYAPHTNRRIKAMQYSTSAAQKTSGPESGDGSFYSLSPYPDTEDFGFGRCKNPTQLEKSIESYLKSHPEPTERVLVTMLTVCRDLAEVAVPVFPATRSKQDLACTGLKGHGDPGGRTKGKEKVQKQQGPRTHDIKATLLKTILDSSRFTSDDVFRVARAIYYSLAMGKFYHAAGASNWKISGDGDDNCDGSNTGSQFPSSSSSSSSSDTLKSKDRPSPSNQITNAFLDVCAVTGNFDEAYAVVKEMMQSPQGNIKPDLMTYRYVLKAATTAGRSYSKANNVIAEKEIEVKVNIVIDEASEALYRQSRMAFWMKIGLGGLAGAAVGKFTMLGIMALPSSRALIQDTNAGVGISTVDHAGSDVLAENRIDIVGSPQSVDGILELLASQEVAMGVGLVAGLLTAGYVIRSSTSQSVATTAVTTEAAATVPISTSKAVLTETVPSNKSKAQRPYRQHHHPNDREPSISLPRAKLFGLYFPDLATTNKNEIRDYLKSLR